VSLLGKEIVLYMMILVGGFITIYGSFIHYIISVFGIVLTFIGLRKIKMEMKTFIFRFIVVVSGLVFLFWVVQDFFQYYEWDFAQFINLIGVFSVILFIAVVNDWVTKLWKGEDIWGTKEF